MNKEFPEEPIKQFIWDKILFVFPENCFEELIIRFNIFHVRLILFLEKCPKLVLSRVLGLLIVLGSVFVKIPQIIKMLNAKSGAGVSLTSNFLEIFAITSMLAYGYSNRFNFSAYGDALFLAIQTSIIAFLIMWYSKRTASAITFIILYIIALAAIAADFIPLNVLATLQAVNIPIGVAARAIQAWENYSNKSTGQLSPITVFLQFAGCLARIFTSVQETGDKLMILSFVISSITNGVIFAQILLYWGRKMPKKLE